MPARSYPPSRLHALLRACAAWTVGLGVAAGLLLLLAGPASASRGRRRARVLTSQRRCAAARARGRSPRACRGARVRRRTTVVKSRSRVTVGPVGWRPRVTTPAETPAGGAPGETVEKVKKSKRKEPGTGEGGLPQDSEGVVTDPIDPRFLTKDPFGAISFWMQPWRAYLDTWPASRLTHSLGVNFNVDLEQAEPVAQLLQESGFTLARREIPWGALSYEDPTEFRRPEKIDGILTALRNHGLRPLILLNANSTTPGPEKIINLSTLAPALPGAMTVRLDPASAALVVPGKTGFCGLTWGEGPDVLITSVNSEGLATLSRPLRETLAVGKHRAATLLYAPFQAPKLPSGEANPVFEETLAGWLSYVDVVNKEAAKVLGPGNYDLEVWNELSFGSQFLNYEHYYQPADSRTAEAEALAAGQIEAQDLALAPSMEEAPESPESRADVSQIESSEGEVQAPEGGGEEETPAAEEAEEALAPAARLSPARGAFGPAASASAEADPEDPERRDTTKAIINDKVTKFVTNRLLKETVAYVRNPAHGFSPNVGISDGFASQTPFPSGALAPLGLTALSKHLYNGAKEFPAAYREKRLKPLNAFGVRDTEGGRGFKALFVPRFESMFPEYFLTALSTETPVRDIAPITTSIYKLQHGREVGPAGGAPVQKWMTEYNLAQGRGVVMQADGTTPAGVTPSAADRAHFEAKALMRHLVAFVNKGLSRDYFFAAAPGALSIVGKAFYTELEAHPGAYPGAALGGETMSGFRELMSRFQGPGPEAAARQLGLVSISQEGNHAQFAGDGTAAHPTLYDRDVLAVLPFQSAPGKFVIPVYVMTRNLYTLYSPGLPSSDVTRFDLPDENFTITLSNLPASSSAPTVSAYDPLRREATPARLLSREGSNATFQIAATDYPRLLTLEYP